MKIVFKNVLTLLLLLQQYVTFKGRQLSSLTILEETFFKPLPFRCFRAETLRKNIMEGCVSWLKSSGDQPWLRAVLCEFFCWQKSQCGQGRGWGEETKMPMRSVSVWYSHPFSRSQMMAKPGKQGQYFNFPGRIKV